MLNGTRVITKFNLRLFLKKGGGDYFGLSSSTKRAKGNLFEGGSPLRVAACLGVLAFLRLAVCLQVLALLRQPACLKGAALMRGATLRFSLLKSFQGFSRARAMARATAHQVHFASCQAS